MWLVDRVTDPVAHRRLRASMIALVGGVVIVLGLLQAVNLSFRYRRRTAAAEAGAVALARILAEHMRTAALAADASLHLIAAHSARIGGPRASHAMWDPVLRAAIAGLTRVASLTIMDTSGVIRQATTPSLVGQSRRSDFLFEELATHPGVGVVASTPIRATTNGRVVIPIGRRLVGADGSFEGVVIATMTPEESREFYKSVDVGRDGTIWVIHQTGLVFLREPPAGDTSSPPTRVPGPLRRAIVRHANGLLTARLESGGPVLITAWRTLERPPMTVAISFGLDEQTQTLRDDALWSLALTAVVAVALGIAARQLVRQIDARAAVEQALVRGAEELVEVQRVAGLGAARFLPPDFLASPSPQLATLLDLPLESGAMPLPLLLDRLVEADRTRLQWALASCVASGDRSQLEVRAKLPAGTERIFWIEAMAERGASAPGASVLAVFQDVTAQRATAQQAIQSERLASIGRFTGGVAHDFNNLLTIIVGYSQIVLANLRPDDPLRAEIDEIQNAGLRAADLTRQLLAFSRQQVLEPKVLDLNATVTEVQKLLLRVIGEDVELVMRLDAALGHIHADPGQIERVMMNLAINARDAMPGGGRLIIETANVDLDEQYARTHPAVTPGRFVLLAMSDTGTGMDKETLSHVFEPFFTTKQRGKGTGLGLATVYGIVTQSGGSVWAYSEPGIGTTLKVYFPRVDLAADSTEAPPLVVEPARGSGTILLVEDEALLRKLARRILELRGYTVIDAANANDALRLAEARGETIDLMITDVVMPGMGGADLARRMTATWPAMRVLYVSGYTNDAIEQHGILGPDVAFLQKPFTPASLTRKVVEVLAAPAVAIPR